MGAAQCRAPLPQQKTGPKTNLDPSFKLNSTGGSSIGSGKSCTGFQKAFRRVEGGQRISEKVREKFNVLRRVPEPLQKAIRRLGFTYSQMFVGPHF